MGCAGGRTRPVPIAVLRLFPSAFEDGPAPRAGNSRRDLGKGLVIAFVSVLCGATSCAGVAAFGQAKESVFRNFLKLWHAVPSQDTRLALCRGIGPKALDAAFGRFLADVAASVQDGDLIAIGGKAARCLRCGRGCPDAEDGPACDHAGTPGHRDRPAVAAGPDSS